eukprot:2893057-Pyramimonas_sp.AAC.1
MGFFEAAALASPCPAGHEREDGRPGLGAPWRQLQGNCCAWRPSASDAQLREGPGGLRHLPDAGRRQARGCTCAARVRRTSAAARNRHTDPGKER